MKILVVNCGSSSLKYQLINMEDESVLAKGNYERIGEREAFLTHKVKGKKYVITHTVRNHEEALEIILKELQNSKYRVIKSLDDIDAIGHRIVHGGELFDKSVLVDEDVIDKIDQCAVLAPLHNPAAILGIRACQNAMPGKPMVTTFDTAFHQTMPPQNYMYPIPYVFYDKYKIRKYGAHGTSHQFVDKIAREKMGNKPGLKVVTCHLGQGASISAIKDGKCVDTSMGLSPLGGIAMVTRSGDLDPSVVTAIMEKEDLSPRETTALLNKQSGLYGITGLVPDFREIEQVSYDPDYPKATIAIELFVQTVAQFIAKYAVQLRGIDAIVFTGGIGENQIRVRERICGCLEWMGVSINREANNVKGEEVEISTPDSKVKVYVIPTNEELVIARDTKAIVENL